MKQADRLIYRRNNNCLDATNNLKVHYVKLKEAVDRYDNVKSNRKAMNRNWSNQKANPALKTKTGNK